MYKCLCILYIVKHIFKKIEILKGWGKLFSNFISVNSPIYLNLEAIVQDQSLDPSLEPLFCSEDSLFFAHLFGYVFCNCLLLVCVLCSHFS